MIPLPLLGVVVDQLLDVGLDELDLGEDLGLDPGTRKAADTAAGYLLAKKPHLDYPTALANGWPIATGVIEGARRRLVKDRMDITGARWHPLEPSTEPKPSSSCAP